MVGRSSDIMIYDQLIYSHRALTPTIKIIIIMNQWINYHWFYLLRLKGQTGSNLFSRYRAWFVIERSRVRFPAESGGRIFFSRVDFLCWLIRYPLRQRVITAHVKQSVILPKKKKKKMQVAGYSQTRIHPWPKEVRVGWLCCPGIERKPVRETSSHATRQGTLVHSRLELLSHCGLILAPVGARGLISS